MTKEEEKSIELVRSGGLISECAKLKRDIAIGSKTAITERSKHSPSIDLGLYAGFVIVTLPVVARDDFGKDKDQRRTQLIGVL